jgi:hypothetical protein
MLHQKGAARIETNSDHAHTCPSRTIVRDPRTQRTLYTLSRESDESRICPTEAAREALA